MAFWPFRRHTGKPAKPGGPETAGPGPASEAPPPGIEIRESGSIAALGDLPVWIDLPRNSDAAVPLDLVLWDHDPMAEYGYYLAGDFDRTTSGRLRYETASLVAEARVTFEADAWAVEGGPSRTVPHAYNQMSVWNAHARDAGWVAADHADGTVAEMLSAVAPLTEAQGLDRGIARAEGPAEDTLHERSVIEVPRNGWPGFACRLRYVQLRPSGAPDQRNRVLDVTLTCRDPAQYVGPLLEQYLTLARRYQDMPWQALSGATRV